MIFCKKTCISKPVKRAFHTQKIHHTKTIQGNCLPVANFRDFLQKNGYFVGTKILHHTNTAPTRRRPTPFYRAKFILYRYIILIVYPLYTHKIHWRRIFAIFCKKTNYSRVKTNYSRVKTNYSWVNQKFFQVSKPAPRADFQTFEKC